jgi:hypothetical protein
MKNQIRKALFNVALQYCKELSYDFKEDKDSSSWYKPDHDQKDIYIYQKPNTKENRTTNGYVCLRSRFDNPRIGIYGPEKKWFVAIEINVKTGEFAESQVFYPEGVERFKEVHNRVMNELEKELNS